MNRLQTSLATPGHALFTLLIVAVLQAACAQNPSVVKNTAIPTPTASIDWTALIGPAPTPKLFLPGLITTPEHDEGGLHLARDGSNELYFWRRLPGQKQQLYVTTYRADAGWTAPTRLPFSTDRDESPWLSRDGRTMFFASERPIPGRPNRGNYDVNLWRVARNAAGVWGEPTALDSTFNQVQRPGEEWPLGNVSGLATPDDTTFYVSSQRRGDTATTLYRYQLDPLGELVDEQRLTGFFDDPRLSVGGPSFSPDGRAMVFNSYGQPGAAGGEDLYVSFAGANLRFRQKDGRWGPAQALTAINTEHEEAGATFTPDGKYIIFGRAISLGNYEYEPWNLWVVEVEAVLQEFGAAADSDAPPMGNGN